jgi:rsbT co-antagonist protein RsbR
VKNENKTKKQLLSELAELRRRVTELEAAEAERKRAEEELAQERNMLRTLIDNMPDYIYVKDTESRFIVGNVAVGQVMGVKTPDELIGKTDFDFYPQELAARYYADEQEIFRSGQPIINREEPVIDMATNRRGWVSTTKAPFRDERGNIVGLVGIGRDISAQKEAETEREQLQQQVIKAQKRAIQELSTPIIPLMDRIIVMPLIGSIDTLRAKDIMRSLLAGINEYRAKVVILDITGVPIVDSGVANYLNKTIRAARLKGVRTIVTGISDAVAEIIVDLGIDWSEIETLSDLQSGLLVALSSLGIKLTR